MNRLDAFGLFAVTSMVICYAFEDRSPRFVLTFAASCVLASVYGFLQGAWPFGLVEAIWFLLALGRWRRAEGSNKGHYFEANFMVELFRNPQAERGGQVKCKT